MYNQPFVHPLAHAVYTHLASPPLPSYLTPSSLHFFSRIPTTSSHISFKLTEIAVLDEQDVTVHCRSAVSDGGKRMFCGSFSFGRTDSHYTSIWGFARGGFCFCFVVAPYGIFDLLLFFFFPFGRNHSPLFFSSFL
jgi:hypothetical protein